MRLTTIENKALEANSYFLRRTKTTSIKYLPYVSGEIDIYGQRDLEFGSPVELVGRAILNPTEEQITGIGQGETYSIAFLLDRLQLKEKFPTADEGEWIAREGQMEWNQRRYRIIKVHPTGQIGLTFTLVAVLAVSIEGARDVKI